VRSEEKGVRIEIENLKEEIIKRLLPLKPLKIILFGSYAYGVPDEGSDIDLYIVTDDDTLPATFEQRWAIEGKFYEALRDLRRVIPIDFNYTYEKSA